MRALLFLFLAAIGFWCGLAGCNTKAAPPPASAPEVGCDGCIVLQDGLLFDGHAAGRGTVVIEGDHIQAVVPGEVTVRAGQVVALSGKTVLPGLFDLHVHTPAPSAPYGFYPSEDEVPAHLAAMLRAGVTSMLDLGSSAHVLFEYRARIADGRMLGPNLFAVGPLLTPTGGHPCYRGEPAGDACFFVDAPADAAAAVARLAPYRPDAVKLVIESGTSSFSLPRMTRESIAAVAQAAMAAGAPPIAHVSKVVDVVDALDGGVRRFAHVPYDQPVPAEVAARMASLGVMVVPTLAVIDALAQLAAGTLDLSDPTLEDDVPEEVLAALRDPQAGASLAARKDELARDREQALANVRALWQAGVTIAAGTDAGNPGTLHGRAVARELALYVQAGLPAGEALRAATRNGADLLGRADLGRLEAGARADVLVVDGDATADIAAVQRVERVYRAGQLIDRQALSVRHGAPPLTLAATSGRSDGDTCLGAGECSDGLGCSYDQRCARACVSAPACGPRTACFPAPSGGGVCQASDGCDPLAQDCKNGEACVWWGNGATNCSFAGRATAGQACGTYGTCAPGNRCDLQSNLCVRICDPRAPQCPTGTSCIDRSAEAGLPVGDCR